MKIKISKLNLIKTPEQFFASASILFVDFLEMKGLSSVQLGSLRDHPNVFRFEEKYYYQVLLFGSPQNFILKAKTGVPFSVNNQIEGVYRYSGNLIETLQKKKLYDFSGFKNSYDLGRVTIAEEYEFMIERFIKPYKQQIF